MATVLQQPDQVKSQAMPLKDKATIIAFSGDMDRLYAALVIATGAAAMGMEVSIFFTFWGLNAIRKRRSFRGKGICQALLALCLPARPNGLPTSRLNLLGIGPRLFGYMIRKKNLADVAELIQTARRLGVRLIACQSSMELMGITADELLDGIGYGGVATYIGQARDARICLFV